jgi:hypothetical protein
MFWWYSYALLLLAVGRLILSPGWFARRPPAVDRDGVVCLRPSLLDGPYTLVMRLSILGLAWVLGFVWWAWLPLALPALAAVARTVYDLRFCLIITAAGLDCRPAWGARRFIRWEEVARLAYRERTGEFLVQPRSGGDFAVPPEVPGQMRFLDELEKYLSVEALFRARPGYKKFDRFFPAGLLLREADTQPPPSEPDDE